MASKFKPVVLDVQEIKGHEDYARVIVVTAPRGYTVRIVCHDGHILNKSASDRHLADAYAAAIVSTANEEAFT